MSFDADFVKKHKFWLLLVFSIPLLFVSYIVLVTAVSGAIETEKKKVEGKKKALEALGDPKGPKWVEFAKKKAEKFEAQEDKTWIKAWQSQKNLFTWPQVFEREYQFSDGRFAVKIEAYRDTPVPDGFYPMEPKEGEGPKMENVLAGKILETNADFVKGKLLVQKKDGSEAYVYQNYYLTPECEDEEKKATHEVLLYTKIEQGKKIYFEDLKVGDHVKVTFERGKYFGDKMTKAEISRFHREYKSQIHNILAQVQPVDPQGNGVVQLRQGNKYWPFTRNKFPDAGSPFLTYVAHDWIPSKKTESAEAWTAQEDLWIQREIYRLIRLANDYVADFNGKGGEGFNTYTFENPYWNMQIKLTPQNQVEMKLKNRLNRRQRLDISFLVQLHPEEKPARIKVEGEPVEPFKTRDITKPIRTGYDPQGIYGVTQVLNWETAAVKRIDHICIGSGKPILPTSDNESNRFGGERNVRGGVTPTGNISGGGIALSHRVYLKQGLHSFFKNLAAPETPGAIPGEAPSPMGGLERQAPIPEEGGGISPNGIDFNRYVDLTPQARRVPVGVVLIVDQDHVELVQAAFSDSNLRFLTTQTLLNRYPGSVRPVPEITDPVQGGGEFRPGLPFGREGEYSPDSLEGVEDRVTNMELVIYGRVSLYNRYPPREGSEGTPQ